MASLRLDRRLLCASRSYGPRVRGLIGEGVDRETLESLRARVERIGRVDVQHRTRSTGARAVLLVIELRFRDTTSAREIRKAIGRLKGNIRAQYPEIRQVFFGAESITEDGSEINF